MMVGGGSKCQCSFHIDMPAPKLEDISLLFSNRNAFLRSADFGVKDLLSNGRLHLLHRDGAAVVSTDYIAKPATAEVRIGYNRILRRLECFDI